MCKTSAFHKTAVKGGDRYGAKEDRKEGTQEGTHQEEEVAPNCQ